MKSFRGPLQLYLKLALAPGGGRSRRGRRFRQRRLAADEARARGLRPAVAGQLAAARKEFEELYREDDPRVQRGDEGRRATSSS